MRDARDAATGSAGRNWNGAFVALLQQRWHTSMDAGVVRLAICRPESFGSRSIKTDRLIIDRSRCMKFLGYAYRFLSNFVFLALVYYSLNFMEKYQQRAILAILVLIYASMRTASAIRSFYFFQRIERLELEARRLAGLTGEGPAANAARKHIVTDVGVLRRDGEMKSYIDLLFLALVILLCISKIVTD
jgi:hypothetical protein